MLDKRTVQLLARVIVFTSTWFSINLSAFTEPVSSSSPAITSIGKAHALPAIRANGVPVHLLGTVTFYDPADRELFLQDATGGIYVNTDRPYPFHIGDLLEVVGKTGSSYRTEVAGGASIKLVGRGDVYPVPLVRYSELIAGNSDSRLVRVRGRLRAANIEQHENSPSVHLDLVMPGGRTEIYLSNSQGFDAQTLLDAEIEVTGVAGAQFDEKNQVTGSVLYARDFASIHILRRPELTVDRLPITDIDRVFQSRYVTDESSRVRVHGTITYYQKGASVALQAAGNSIFVQTRQTNELKVGDVVDAYGFGSSNEYAPSLRDAFVVETGEVESIKPEPITYDQAISALYSDNLVLMTGIMISQMRRDRSDVLVVDVNGHLITAYIQTRGDFIKLPLGSRITVVGICRIDAGGPWRAPYGFHLDLRDQSDVHLLAYPSWWTVSHLIELLSLITLIAIGTAAWASVLRKRNTKQTLRIQRSMIVAQERSRILEKISANVRPSAVLPEICQAVQRLFPNLDCHFFLNEEGSAKPVVLASVTESKIKSSLTDPEGQEIGQILVISRSGEQLSTEQLELVTSLTELSTMAVRQALLYDGLVHHSTHDPLTNLPNRRLCENRLALALENAARENKRLAVIYVDVNRFKEVNDKFGHKVGDSYLKLISQRFIGQIRPHDVAARIGGDEFLLIVPLSMERENADDLVARLRSCFDSPFHVDEVQITGSASFGAAIYPDDGLTADELKRNADYAMYMAKRADWDSAQGPHNLSIVTASELQSALQRDQFKLAYQPQFSAEGYLTGLEALLRLEDPTLGILTPDAFISVAERSGAIRDIGMWVLKQALRDAIRWRLHEGDPVLIAVNVSIRQVEEVGFAQMVLDALKEAAFPANRLELEIVERSLLSTGNVFSGELEQLHAAGVRLSLDDFGTGESCLSMLHTLPVDTIKIDRSFILAMDDEPKVLPIIQAISFLGRSLGKRIVAEGLEHAEAVTALLAIGPIEFQGYLFGRPAMASQIDQVIAEWRQGIDMPSISEGEHSRLP